MIILDTHIWIWWVNESSKLTEKQKQIIKENQVNGLGISAISCWEVAKLVEKKETDIVNTSRRVTRRSINISRDKNCKFEHSDISGVNAIDRIS